jgi:hypothetical protein
MMDGNSNEEFRVDGAAEMKSRGGEEDHHGVDDEEVQQRRDELVSGKVKGLSEAEFREACGR